ncbi:hypothetical protein P7M41_25455, partial [Vibrio parahaemolyticus]|nr:hypothetical protein [Vibrio parahaemolyticus]MDF4264821.1 hypothetical protein [Vibrio parahaemolyticus]MDF4326757.1 hypothetical protein [Vibrio parahaemolyticus]MDG2555348.1 hypothetical protein [Vibrio parahaemolyticus]
MLKVSFITFTYTLKLDKHYIAHHSQINRERDSLDTYLSFYASNVHNRCNSIDPHLIEATHLYGSFRFAAAATMQTNAALRCERRLAILERSETAKRCE